MTHLCKDKKCGDTCDMSFFGVKYCHSDKSCVLRPVRPNCPGNTFYPKESENCTLVLMILINILNLKTLLLILHFHTFCAGSKSAVNANTLKTSASNATQAYPQLKCEYLIYRVPPLCHISHATHRVHILFCCFIQAMLRSRFRKEHIEHLVFPLSGLLRNVISISWLDNIVAVTLGHGIGM